MACFNLLYSSCTYLLGHCADERGTGDCGNAHSCCLLLNGFYKFHTPELESESRAHKRNARRAKKRGREIKVRPSRREESTRCPICTTPRENALDCNCNEHTRKVSSGCGEATATTAAKPARDVIQFHIQRFLKTFF